MKIEHPSSRYSFSTVIEDSEILVQSSTSASVSVSASVLCRRLEKDEKVHHQSESTHLINKKSKVDTKPRVSAHSSSAAAQQSRVLG